MTKYEYKTVTVKQKGTGLFTSRSIPELEEILNKEAREGWALKEIISPSGYKGESDKIIIIFEREIQS